MNTITMLQNTFAAVAFAESNLREESLTMAGLVAAPRNALCGLESLAASVAFAEAGDRDATLRMAGLSDLADSTVLNRLEALAASVAFAEADDRDTSLWLANLTPSPERAASMSGLEGIYAAAAFAECGLEHDAMAMVGRRAPRPGNCPDALIDFMSDIGLMGVQFRYGLARI
ncbi:MAG: hypothetical protein AB7E47_07095 [Desulfovibrionaceae bacterium]